MAAVDEYYTAPIELYRGFLENPHKCLSNVADYLLAGYSNYTAAEQALGIKWNSHENGALKQGKALRGQHYSGVMFSISRKMYWDYYKNPKTTEQLLLLLAYLSLKSMNGNRTYRVGNSQAMFIRMAGYGNRQDYETAGGHAAVGVIGNYMQTQRMMSYHGRNIRLSVMETFKEFHCYSDRGKRGFFYIFSNRDRAEGLYQLAQFAAERTKRYRDNKLKDQMKAAREKVLKTTDKYRKQ